MGDNLRRVFLIRHGRTPLNAEGRIRGLANPELDEVGKQQALATARALRAEGICHVASSPLRRAAVTADIIAGEVGADRTIDDAFNDRDYGPWTGHLKARWSSSGGRSTTPPASRPQPPSLPAPAPPCRASRTPPLPGPSQSSPTTRSSGRCWPGSSRV